MTRFCQLWLTCKDSAEATTIAQKLLDEKLIVCAKQLPVSSDFLWHGKIDHNDEILLVMDSRPELFEKIEQAVSVLHSYDTFVLHAVPVLQSSTAASTWIKQELQ